MPKNLLLISLIFWACRPPTTPEAQEGVPLFRQLSSLRTGINFANNLTYTEEFNPYTYRNFYKGEGLDLALDRLPRAESP